MPLYEQKDKLAPVEQELLAEKASALGRASERLEQALAELAAKDAALAHADEAARASLTAERRALRDAAAERLWFLFIQREAIGIRQHEPLRALYRVPPDVWRLAGPRKRGARRRHTPAGV